MLKPIGHSASENYASLEFIPLPLSEESRRPGLISVGEEAIPENQRLKAYVARGKRSISYFCSGPFVFDYLPSITFDFKPNTSYELICSRSAPFIREKSQ